MKKRFLILNLVLALIAGTPASAQTPTGREVMEAYKAQDHTKDSAAEMTMSIVNERGSTRARELTVWAKTGDDDTRMQLIRFRTPADVAGTGFLSIENQDRDDDNWLYLPALGKTRRIAGTDKQDSFVGTDFTYEDLDRENLSAYSYTVTGSDTVNGVGAWIVEAVPTDPEKIKETGYSKRELWIGEDRHLILKARFYDKDGAYVKRLHAADIRKVPGSDKWRPWRVTMEDVQKGGKTVLEISSYEIDQGVSEDYFSQRYLKRGV